MSPAATGAVPDEHRRVGTTGVGVVGAGPVTQAIHLPTLARLGDLFHVARVMDVEAGVAEAVASRAGAAWTTSAVELLADEAVEVVAICSPHAFHAEQVVAACRAGKRAVLCEKPLATDRGDAEAIARASAETGVPVVVGAMHTFDPGWRAARASWFDLAASAHTLRSSIVLPPNPRFEDAATEVLARPEPSSQDRHDPRAAADTLRASILGLAVHDLPLVRALCPDWTDVEVLAASVPDPWGHHVDLRVGGRDVQLHAVSTSSWELEWTLEALSDDAWLRVDFTPSYVQAGSARAVLRRAGREEAHGPFPTNGYEEEWRFLAALVRGSAEAPDVPGLVDDLVFALDVADRASAALLSAAGHEASAGASR